MGSRPSDFVLTTPGPLRLYSTTELLKMPEPVWHVYHLFPYGGMVTMVGEPGTAKSFLALDLALSIATGRPWQGRTLQRGFVVYIAAEGGTGISKRVKAWLQHHGVDPSQANIAWLVEPLPVNLDSEQLEMLRERIRSEIGTNPDFIVIDTLARCFDGDENLQEDMNRFVAGVDALRHEFYPCTVLIVHHTRLDGMRERGSTAFRGGADTMMHVSKSGNDIVLSCTKQKDAEEFEDIQLELLAVDGTNSCVVVRGQASARAQDAAQTALAALQASFVNTSTGEEGSLPTWRSWDDWREATGLDQRQFQKAFYQLKKDGKVEKKGGKWGAKVGAKVG